MTLAEVRLVLRSWATHLNSTVARASPILFGANIPSFSWEGVGDGFTSRKRFAEPPVPLPSLREEWGTPPKAPDAVVLSQIGKPLDRRRVKRAQPGAKEHQGFGLSDEYRFQLVLIGNTYQPDAP